jgi:hypothetical protein
MAHAVPLGSNNTQVAAPAASELPDHMSGRLLLVLTRVKAV